MMKGGYWKAPRELARMLERGELTPTEYALLVYVAQAGADREQGFPATYATLMRVLGVSEKTVSRALGKLRRESLVSFHVTRGQRKPFTLRLGTRLQTPETEVVSEVTSYVTSDTTRREGGRVSPSGAGLRSDTTSDTTSTPKRPETEVLHQAVTAYLSGGGSLERSDWRSALERQAASLVRKGLPAELVEAAARELGRERAFPGYLARRVDELQRSGGPCRWAGLSRGELTPPQLAECACSFCREWAAHADEPTRPVT